MAWSEIAAPPDEAGLASLEYANLEVLGTLWTLEGYGGERGEDNPEVGSSDLARLDFKLNLLLELVGQLFIQQQILPKAHLLTLMPDSMLWQDTVAPTLNALLRIELYCSVKYPRPLVLHGRVMELRALADGWMVRTAFQGLSESMQEGLERFIFIHHRRTIAQSRHL